ncbi:MAG: hypothetical protein ACYSU7_13825 [Planctomycetota bacterium]|jgi:hypothetical protein
MRKFISIVAIIAAAALGVAYLSGAAFEEEKEEQVTLDQVPKAVQATILREAGDGIILEIVREIEGDRVVYEAEILFDGVEIVEVEVATNGRVLEREARGVDEQDDEDEGEDEDEGDEDDEDADRIPVNQVPAPALRVLREYAGDRNFVASREQEHGVTVYEARWEVDGRPTEVVVTADGVLLEIEEIVPEDAVPADVLRAVDGLFAAGAERVYEKKIVVIYEVETVVDGRAREVLVLPTGRVLHED